MPHPETPVTKNEPLHFTAALTIEAASAGKDQTPAHRRFSMRAYTGGALALTGWRYPVVVDLAGLQVNAKSRPIFVGHSQDVDDLLGQTDRIEILEGQLIATGEVLGDSPRVGRVIALADKGFAWQASIGARTEQVEFVKEGQTVTVNGREVTGPVNIARRTVLGEISFVTLGADADTSAVIARGHLPEKESTTMSQPEKPTVETVKKQEIAAPGPGGAAEPATPATEPAQQEVTATAAASAAAQGGETPAAITATAAPPSVRDQAADLVHQMRATAAAEATRIAAIRQLCAQGHSDLEAQAIGEGWDANKTELEVLRATRPTAPAAIHTHDQALTGEVLEAACLLTAGLAEPEKICDEQHLDLAAKRFRGGIGLQELLLEAAWANGFTGRNFRDNRTVLRFAFGHNVQAGYSTVDIGGILSNVANKFLLEGFFSVERTWRSICAVRNVSDFRAVTSYRLIGIDQYEKVTPGGELKHGTLGEESYSNQADTYGLLLSVDRRDVINDDLGAITTVPRKLGRGSGLKLNDVFWTTFLDNATFFKADNNNYLAGADTVLGINGLTKAEVAFMDHVDGDGKPIGIMPAILLVPTALSATGTALHKSLELRDTTASNRYPVANPHQGKFRTVVSRYLANSQYSGSSAKAWYLLAEPADLPVIETAFLNGREAPTIETAEADFNVLGVQMRGYHDFGCALQDPKGGVKAKGEN